MNERILVLVRAMMDINKIKDSIKADNYEMSQHALERALERDIWKEDIEHAIINGEIIEEYEEDKPYSSCLIFGKNEKGEPIHIVCAFSPIIRVITIYRPDEDKWIEYKRRK